MVGGGGVVVRPPLPAGTSARLRRPPGTGGQHPFECWVSGRWQGIPIPENRDHVPPEDWSQLLAMDDATIQRRMGDNPFSAIAH